MIKICFIDFHIYPLFNANYKDFFGGAQIQLYFLANALAQDNNFDISFIVKDCDQNAIEYFNNIKIYKGPKMNKVSFPKRMINLFPKPRRLVSLIKKINADIYIQRAASEYAGLICSVAHLINKKFIYMSAHDIDCNGQFEKDNGWLNGKLFQYGIRHADLVITQSQIHQNMIKQHHKKTSFILKSAHHIPPSTTAIDQQNRFYTLWVGRCTDWKQPEIFIKLAQTFPHEKFLMIMPAHTNHAYYQKIIQTINNTSNIKHIQYVPFHNIDRYFAYAKIFVQTSSAEGFPNTFVQAAKNKTPIISLSVNPDNFLEKYNCGFCANSDLDKLVSRFQLILNNHKLQSHLSQNAYNYVKTYHNIELIAETFKTTIKNTVHNGSHDLS